MTNRIHLYPYLQMFDSLSVYLPKSDRGVETLESASKTISRHVSVRCLNFITLSLNHIKLYIGERGQNRCEQHWQKNDASRQLNARTNAKRSLRLFKAPRQYQPGFRLSARKLWGRTDPHPASPSWWRRAENWGLGQKNTPSVVLKRVLVVLLLPKQSVSKMQPLKFLHIDKVCKD